jgi:hypothetical protein
MLGAAKEQTVKRTHIQNQARFNVHGSPECYQDHRQWIASRDALRMRDCESATTTPGPH